VAMSYATSILVFPAKLNKCIVFPAKISEDNYYLQKIYVE